MKKILLLTVFSVGIGTQAIAGFGEVFDVWEKDSGIPLRTTFEVYKAQKTLKNIGFIEQIEGIRPSLDETNHSLFDAFVNHHIAKSEATVTWAQQVFQAVEEGKISTRASYKEFKKANYHSGAEEKLQNVLEDCSVKKLKNFITAVTSTQGKPENLLEKKNVGQALTNYNESLLSLIRELKVKEALAPLQRLGEEIKQQWDACIALRLKDRPEEERKS